MIPQRNAISPLETGAVWGAEVGADPGGVAVVEVVEDV
jgi:hypothetical protein